MKEVSETATDKWHIIHWYDQWLMASLWLCVLLLVCCYWLIILCVNECCWFSVDCCRRMRREKAGEGEIEREKNTTNWAQGAKQNTQETIVGVFAPFDVVCVLLCLLLCVLSCLELCVDRSRRKRKKKSSRKMQQNRTIKSKKTLEEL